MPAWLNQVTYCAKEAKNQRTQLVAVNVLIKIIKEPSNRYSLDQTEKNIYLLQQLISPEKARENKGLNELEFDRKLSPERMNKHRSATLVAVGSDTKMLRMQSEHQRKVDTDEEDEPKEQVEDQTIDIIGKLWSLLDYPGDHEKIVNLLIEFDYLKPKTFSRVITKDLDSENREGKRRAVERFSTFWKIAMQTKRGSHINPSRKNQYMPFQPVSERECSSFEDFQDQSKEDRVNLYYNPERRDGRDYDALHKMLMILEDKDPTLRLSARSWL